VWFRIACFILSDLTFVSFSGDEPAAKIAPAADTTTDVQLQQAAAETQGYIQLLGNLIATPEIPPSPPDSIGGTTDSTFFDNDATGTINFYHVRAKTS
jgi:hypothetical protein